jgi:predicted dithiol-disulfide oxidoreductase (DUF899 family)
MSALPRIVGAEEWQQERDELLVAEKELTRATDALAARRRRLPMVEFDVGRYTFATTSGPKSLLDLFGDHSQLVVYQFMDRGPDHFCPGCTNFTNQVVRLDDLAECGIAWWSISNMPLEQFESYRIQKGWEIPIASSRGTSFTEDCGAGDVFLLNCFVRDGDRVFRTYSTTGRGVDRVMFVMNILDLTVYGRKEDWEDSPAGWPQEPTYG